MNTRQPEQAWIDVNDRLPEKADEGSSAYKCLVAYRSGDSFGISLSWFELGDEFNNNGFSGDVTHWQPLPAKPVCEGGGE